MLSVAQIMTPRAELACLGPDDDLAAARRLMARRHIRHIPILDAAGGLTGLVSHRDLLAATPPAGATAGPREPHLGEIMSRRLATVHPAANVRQAAMRLRRLGIGCLPVMRDGELLGIVTDSDFVWVAVHLLEQLEESEPVAEV